MLLPCSIIIVFTISILHMAKLLILLKMLMLVQ